MIRFHGCYTRGFLSFGIALKLVHIYLLGTLLDIVGTPR
jgi:hypothetical protein